MHTRHSQGIAKGPMEESQKVRGRVVGELSMILRVKDQIVYA